jgi:hypothetical protein
MGHATTHNASFSGMLKEPRVQKNKEYLVSVAVGEKNP